MASLKSNRGNFCRSARSLGVHRNTLRNKVSDLGIGVEDYDLTGRRQPRRKSRLGNGSASPEPNAYLNAGQSDCQAILKPEIGPPWHEFRSSNSLSKASGVPWPVRPGCAHFLETTCGRGLRLSSSGRRLQWAREENRPMKQSRNRVSLAVLATVLTLAISLGSTPSDTSVPAPYQQPVPQKDAAELQDLAHWMIAGRTAGGADGRSAPRSFQAIRTEDFEAAVSTEPQELSLFEPGPLGPDIEARRRFLHGLPYGTAIALAAERHEVDGLLLAAIVAVESGFTPEAVSPRGATGLMQVRPAVGRAYGTSDLFDPHANVDAGTRYLRSLMKDYEGDLELTLAAYNAGPAAVARYGGVPPYRETRAYVRKVMARYEEYSRRANEAPPGARAARVL